MAVAVFGDRVFSVAAMRNGGWVPANITRECVESETVRLMLNVRDPFVYMFIAPSFFAEDCWVYAFAISGDKLVPDTVFESSVMGSCTEVLEHAIAAYNLLTLPGSSLS